MEAGFESKVYVVTGGAAGIGLAIVSRLLSYGAIVYATDVHEHDTTGISALRDNKNLTYIQCDVRDRPGCHSLITTLITKHGRLDGVVNNAGICPTQGELPSDDLYEEIFGVNVRGSWNMATEAFVPMMKQGYGSVVNIGSTSCLVGKNRLPLYAATKHAVLGLTRSWALDFAKYGIRVNCVGPGGTDTAMGRAPLKAVMGPKYGLDKSEDELLACVAASIPMGRIATPDDQANAVIFFLSDFSSYITGQILCVAGGS